MVAKSGPLNNEALRNSIVLPVEKTKPASRRPLKTLSEFLQASRRARVSELATDLARPALDSPVGLFDVRASYAGSAALPAVGGKVSRSLFASALSLDTAALGNLRSGSGGGKVQFRLGQVAIPGARRAPKITNAALLLAGIETGTLAAKVTLAASGVTAAFSIVNGLAMSNRLHFSDGIAGNSHPLNALANQSPTQTVEVEIRGVGAAGALLEQIRDVVLWLEYEHLT